MREGKVLTRTIEHEPRQHKLFIDLGEGPLRAQLVFGMVAYGAWLALTLPLFLLLGWANKYTAMLFLLPPGLLTAYGWTKPENNPRRRLVTQWVLTARWLLRGHEPVVTLGRHRAYSDSVRFRDRVAARFGDGDLLAVALPSRLHQDHPVTQSKVRPRGQRSVVFKPAVRVTTERDAAALLLRERRLRKRAGRVAVPTTKDESQTVKEPAARPEDAIENTEDER